MEEQGWTSLAPGEWKYRTGWQMDFLWCTVLSSESCALLYNCQSCLDMIREQKVPYNPVHWPLLKTTGKLFYMGYSTIISLCARQPLNGKALERANSPVYWFHVLSALAANIPLSEGHKNMLFPSRRTSVYQNHSTQNGCFISVLFSAFWILYSDIGSFLLQWDISEGYKMWPPFWDHLVYLRIHPYFLDLFVCEFPSLKSVSLPISDIHLWDTVCAIYLISQIWEHFWMKVS